MSATELIQQVAALPPQEKVLFEQLYRGMESGNCKPGKSSQPQWPDFGERLRRIYGDKVAPDSTSIIDEGRGEG
jgi:hypothetical protein